MTKAQKPSILLTGFAPFGGESINPSWQAVSVLEGEHIGGCIIHTKELSCEFDTSLRELHQAIDKYAPQLVLCVGQAGGRADISIERVAINVNDARIADNAGKQPIDTQVIAGAPSAYFTNLSIKRILMALQQAELPASISNSAGTYVCNHVMYGLMHMINQHDTHIKGGFIHIPYLPSQALHHPNAPSMSLDMVLSALKVIITSAIQNKDDIKVAAGTTH
ncbi:Pyrrolidone-carboxylate peptidase [Pseudoalteromonas holothuriae]|uniref:Pyrrolidone-carboxylate peptidase n=1 Tax=Pseudoalteromonas holothuriae TaxID=2963714 RepID=A0A9W4VSE1_9GAMM|nr:MULTISPECIES: pyroglutamyl-peptidase I [unclassified Pseudoalteromonas]CAH9060837.1 Pyrrolidone-carboxylate peptidase [Pseudoalteromonas sp. CIP111951]CAH9060997.1 Pyrrolidone-carboxylate peptidase [Pseudoalteromonas sp. CIP111854]